ncbi:hypothetical protein [Rodentibacter pneumotropicus]|uniref:DUF3742 family protein n=1 Tax=Rodentibacter pneumotropicus TaxID=758 RepID=A0A4S2Q372_9PAST|nr:hypothetical protein [Rodentibacter pneumotropicus]THA11003.1 hypothetical protein D3M78_01020 [Rodentibacter pneumotropicus]
MKFPRKRQIQNILVKLKNFLIPQKIQDISMQSFYYTKYLTYRFKNWEHPKSLKSVYLIFIVLAVLLIISVSLVLALSLFALVFISPLKLGSLTKDIIYYTDGYEENGMYYPYYNSDDE